MIIKAGNTSEHKKTSLEETLKLLETTTDGLTDSQVKNRLEIFGYNEIAEKRRILFLRFYCVTGGTHAMVVRTSDGAYIHIETLS